MLFCRRCDAVVGFGFKIATAPFHIWTPDVYEGAPTPVTAFMAAGPKAAGFALPPRLCFRISFVLATNNQAGALLHTSWLSVLAVLAVITMFVGNVAAIVQNNCQKNAGLFFNCSRGLCTRFGFCCRRRCQRQ